VGLTSIQCPHMPPMRWTNRSARGPHPRGPLASVDQLASARATSDFGPCASRFAGRFCASGWAKFTKKGDSLFWTPMNRRAKLDAASVILGGEFRNHTNKQTNKQWTIYPHLAYRHVWIKITISLQRFKLSQRNLVGWRWGPHRALRTTSCMNFVTVTVASCR